MPKKRHKPEEIVAKLRQVDVLAPRGQSAADAVRATGVMEVTYYRGRQDYGVLKPDQMKRLKDLEAKKTRLHRVVSDSTIDKMILEEAAKGPIPDGLQLVVGKRKAAFRVPLDVVRLPIEHPANQDGCFIAREAK